MMIIGRKSNSSSQINCSLFDTLTPQSFELFNSEKHLMIISFAWDFDRPSKSINPTPLNLDSSIDKEGSVVPLGE